MTSKKAQKVLLATPHGHEVTARWTKCVLNLVAYDMANHGRIVNGGNFLLNSSGANVTNARNEIVAKFLETDIDWLWFCDTDMTFEPDVLDRLVDAAHPTLRPVVGALCFSLQDGFRACPTLYVLRDDNKVGRVFDYPKNTLMRVLTGTGCVLIHRSALETVKARNFNPAYPWFQETNLDALPLGEDISFFLRCEALGVPVHVDTSVKCGHEKPFVVDESMYDAQVAAGLRGRAEPTVPTYVVVPVIDENDPIPSIEGAAGVVVVPNTEEPLNLSAKWNHGLDMVEKHAAEMGLEAWNVAILNDDLEVPPDLLARLSAGLRMDDDHWLAYPDVTGRLGQNEVQATISDSMAGQTMTGYAFMLRGESPLRFDEQFRWWYGDSDIERQVREAGKLTVCVGGATVNHLRPMQSTRGDLLALAREDEACFAQKWSLNPATLYLAQHETET